MKGTRKAAITMALRPSRRGFLQAATTAGAAAGLCPWASIAPLSPASAAQHQVAPDLVRFSPDIEPIVRLIEETPQEKCVAAMIEQLRRGLPYRNFVAALYLAAIRAARWHGSGMHAFDHSAYVVHSAYQLALDLPPGEQLLPAFFALISFKGMQKAYPGRTGTPELTGTLPAAEHAASELRAGMDGWDSERAERAVVALARSRGRSEVLESLWSYAGRTWGFIGHMPILVASSARLLETIGWQHAEPILRYVVQGLAGWGKEHDSHADMQPYWSNQPRVERAAGNLPADWAVRRANEGLTQDLVALLRDSKADAACDLAVTELTSGRAKAGAVWDAVHLAAGELLLCSKPFNPRGQTNGDALHANTAVNALHYAFRASGRPDTRLLLLMQGLAWLPLYRKLIIEKQLFIPAIDLTRLIAAELPATPESAIEAILASRTQQPHDAARLAFAFGQKHPPQPLLNAARRLLPMKSTGDPHDIKFPVAIFEDLDLISGPWRPHLLAAAVLSFWCPDRPDNPRMEEARDAIRGL
jgi:hypothetical protein